MLSRAAYFREYLSSRFQNEFRSAYILPRVHVHVLDGRFTKVRNVIHALLDAFLWLGVFILDCTRVCVWGGVGGVGGGTVEEILLSSGWMGGDIEWIALKAEDEHNKKLCAGLTLNATDE